MSTHHPHRRTPSALKTSSKGQRPGLGPRSLSSPKIALGKKRATEIELGSDASDSDDDMTFLQYCPTCEKQIVVPNTSILYCSESCRRKDITPPNSAPVSTYSSSPSPRMEPNTKTRNIVPPREPSTRESFASKPAMDHDAKSDLDPTEWKPNLRSMQSDGGPRKPTRPPHARTQSAAHLYLAGFHKEPSSSHCVPRNRSSLHIASTAPGLISGGRNRSDSDTESDAGSTSSSRESSIVGTPGDNQSLGSCPLVYTASTATMTLDVKGEMYNKSVVEGQKDIEGGLKKLLIADGRM